MSNLQMRIITAIFLITISLTATWFGGMPFRLFILGIGAAIYHEWQMITLPRQTPLARITGWLFYAIIAVLLLIGWRADEIFIVILVAAMILALAGRRNGGWWAGGFLYALAAPVILSFLRDGMAGLHAVLCLYAVVWATDSGAYFAGRALGGPKLAPKISPNKTWAGAIGGLLAAIGVGFIIDWGLPDLVPHPLWVFVWACLLSIAAQMGDLGESWLKRHFNVKDSGSILPGHGGFMDRADGMIAASVAFYLIIQMFLWWLFS